MTLHWYISNPLHACAFVYMRMIVIGLCVCLSVCLLPQISYVLRLQKNNTRHLFVYINSAYLFNWKAFNCMYIILLKIHVTFVYRLEHYVLHNKCDSLWRSWWLYYIPTVCVREWRTTHLEESTSWWEMWLLCHMDPTLLDMLRLSQNNSYWLSASVPVEWASAFSDLV